MDFNPEVANEICARLANGESLRKICGAERDDFMPGLTTVYQWLATQPEFANQYAHARETQGETYADRAIDEALTATDAAIGRLRMDALKWAASKLAPKKYGEKTTTELTGPGGGPVEIRWAQTASEATHDPSAKS